MKRALVAILLFWLGAYIYLSYRPMGQATYPASGQSHALSITVQTARPTAESGVEPPEPDAEVEESPEPEKRGKWVLPYKLKNGLMIVQGDLVAGAPTHPDLPDTGLVKFAPLKLWKNGVVPFHIQPDVTNPERVMQAIAMFEGTAVHLVAQNGEEDVLVFEPGDEDCLSYVGKMGGKQPLWISPNCGPAEVAHEILHALGFVHEQNRADRDDFVLMHFENVDDRYTDNFEKLPAEFMKVSGLGPFDFQSLMIYPPWMFAKNGQVTMEPKTKDKLIEPSTRLSAGDIARINLAYGNSVPAQ